jgi:hypothetical protein
MGALNDLPSNGGSFYENGNLAGNGTSANIIAAYTELR